MTTIHGTGMYPTLFLIQICFLLLLTTTLAFGEEVAANNAPPPAAGINWYDYESYGIVGAVLGVSLGLYGGVFGCLAGYLVPRGKGRKLIMNMVVFNIVLGVAFLLFGISALLLGYLFNTWYLFVLCGAIFVFISPPQFFAVRNAYERFEQCKMQALDL